LPAATPVPEDVVEVVRVPILKVTVAPETGAPSTSSNVALTPAGSEYWPSAAPVDVNAVARLVTVNVNESSSVAPLPSVARTVKACTPIWALEGVQTTA
jgi:hypothetical protein